MCYKLLCVITNFPLNPLRQSVCIICCARITALSKLKYVESTERQNPFIFHNNLTREVQVKITKFQTLIILKTFIKNEKLKTGIKNTHGDFINHFSNLPIASENKQDQLHTLSKKSCCKSAKNDCFYSKLGIFPAFFRPTIKMCVEIGVYDCKFIFSFSRDNHEKYIRFH